MEQDNSFRILSLAVIIPAVACVLGGTRQEREGRKSFEKEPKVTLSQVELHSIDDTKAMFDADGNLDTYEYVGLVRSGKLKKDSIGSTKKGATWLKDMNMVVYKEKGRIDR